MKPVERLILAFMAYKGHSLTWGEVCLLPVPRDELKEALVSMTMRDELAYIETDYGSPVYCPQPDGWKAFDLKLFD